MARKGPQPKPTAVRLLHGDKADRINRDEPVPPPGVPDRPVMSGEAGKVWEHTVPLLLAMGVLRSTDGDALGAYCEAVAQVRATSLLIERTGIIVESTKGTPIRNPALATQRDAMRTVLYYSREFGLTPSARSTLHASPGHVDKRETLLS